MKIWGISLKKNFFYAIELVRLDVILQFIEKRRKLRRVSLVPHEEHEEFTLFFF